MASPAAVTSLLYVGEDAELVNEASAVLSAENHDVSVESTDQTEDVERRLDDGDVDCLVCEQELAGGSGSEFLRDVHETYPDLPSIYLAENTGGVNAALEAGASDVLVRRDTVDATTLLARRLEHVLRGRTEAGEPDPEDQLRRERDFTDLLLDTLDDVFYLVDTAGNMERWNESLRTVTGYTNEEIDGMQALDFFVGEGKERVGEAIAETLEEGSSDVEAAFVTKDGEEIPYHFTGAKLTDDDGTIRGLVGIGRDISERKELEEQLREKASLLDHIFDQIPTALFVKDTDARHLRMSDYDRDPGEVDGKTDPEIYGETEFTEETYADDLRVIEDGERVVNKEEYNPENGEWTLTSKVPWHDEDGEIQGLIGVSRLITEKKEYEAELNVRNRAMAEAPIGITIHDGTPEDRPITYANDTFQEVTGYDKETVDGRTFALLSGPDTDAEEFETIETAFDRMESASTVLLLYRADRTPFWGRVTVAPVTDESGAVAHFVSFLQDVTETKEHAQEIERRLNEFGDLLAEELRTPLQRAEETIKSLDADGDDEEVAAAERSVQQVDKLIDDLATVHSFSVKPRDLFETANAGEGGE